jgi:hypothetical protein
MPKNVSEPPSPRNRKKRLHAQHIEKQIEKRTLQTTCVHAEQTATPNAPTGIPPRKKPSTCTYPDA